VWRGLADFLCQARAVGNISLAAERLFPAVALNGVSTFYVVTRWWPGVWVDVLQCVFGLPSALTKILEGSEFAARGTHHANGSLKCNVMVRWMFESVHVRQRGLGRAFPLLSQAAATSSTSKDHTVYKAYHST